MTAEMAAEQSHLLVLTALFLQCNSGLNVHVRPCADPAGGGGQGVRTP